MNKVAFTFLKKNPKYDFISFQFIYSDNINEM